MNSYLCLALTLVITLFTSLQATTPTLRSLQNADETVDLTTTGGALYQTYGVSKVCDWVHQQTAQFIQLYQNDIENSAYHLFAPHVDTNGNCGFQLMATYTNSTEEMLDSAPFFIIRSMETVSNYRFKMELQRVSGVYIAHVCQEGGVTKCNLAYNMIFLPSQFQTDLDAAKMLNTRVCRTTAPDGKLTTLFSGTSFYDDIIQMNDDQSSILTFGEGITNKKLIVDYDGKVSLKVLWSPEANRIQFLMTGLEYQGNYTFKFKLQTTDLAPRKVQVCPNGSNFVLRAYDVVHSRCSEQLYNRFVPVTV